MFHVLVVALAVLHAGTVQGFVRAQGSQEPLPHATVAIPQLGRVASADVRGYFVLANVPDGRWRAEASALGYDTHAVSIVVQGGTVRIDFELPLRPVPMALIEVQGTPTGAGGTAAAPLPQPGPPAVRVQAGALRTVPALVEPDVLRALQALPSIAAMSDFSTALYVRGGAADQSLITLDGMPLFNPYHVGGIFSAIPIDAVSTVDVHAGAMPARAGDRVSGAVHVHTRDGGRDRVRASGGIGLLSSHATLDGPVKQGSWIVSGRRTYLDAVTDAAYALRLTDVTIPYGFWDVYAKATLPVGELGSLAVSGYLDREGIRVPERMRAEAGTSISFDWGSSLLALNFRQALSPSLLLQARAGYTEFRGSFDAWELDRDTQCQDNACGPAGPVRDSSRVVEAQTRTGDLLAGADLTWYRAAHTFRTGGQVDAMRLRNALIRLEDVDERLFPYFDRQSRPVAVALHAEDEWRVGDRLSARLGARLLHVGGVGTALMPRVGANLQLTPVLSVSAGAGSYAQALRSMRNDESMVSSLIAYDLLEVQPADAGLVRGTDYVIGISHASANTALRAEAYAKRLRGLVLPAELHEPMQSITMLADDYTVGTGSAHGLELSAQHRRGPASLSLSYSLAFASRTADTTTWRPRFERRHMIDATASTKWGAHGELSLRAAAGTGQPYTPISAMAQARHYNPATGEWEVAAPRLVLGDYSSERLPGYLRIDVGARRSYSRTWFGRPMTVTPYLQVLNLLNTRNALFAEALPYGGPAGPALRYMPQLPFLPTFGFEWQH